MTREPSGAPHEYRLQRAHTTTAEPVLRSLYLALHRASAQYSSSTIPVVDNPAVGIDLIYIDTAPFHYK